LTSRRQDHCSTTRRCFVASDAPEAELDRGPHGSCFGPGVPALQALATDHRRLGGEP
jgi:hypothetical protein